VSQAVSPRSGGNWEGAGVAPHVETAAGAAFQAAYRLALRDVATGGEASAAEARGELAQPAAPTA
jgi:hypothetical protein